jgi:hypothetical protein
VAEESAPIPLALKASRRVSFDPTINLGHLLTLVSMLAAGAVAFANLQSRLAVHDEQLRGLERSVAVDKNHLTEALNGLRDDVKEVKQEVRRSKP